MVKRIFDIAFALLFLVPAALVVLVCGTIVRATSPGPALFYQRRVGKDGRVFTIVKVRSMYDGSSTEPRSVEEGDPRVTPCGRWLRKTHVDELPQLVNVLLGHMSVVGPRPLTERSIEWALEHEPRFRERLSVRPGITGIAQLRTIGPRTARAKLRLDLFYIRRRSVLLDLWILMQTCALVLRAGFRRRSRPFPLAPCSVDFRSNGSRILAKARL